MNPCSDRLENFLSHYPDFNGDHHSFCALIRISPSDKLWVIVRLLGVEKYQAMLWKVFPNAGPHIYPDPVRFVTDITTLFNRTCLDYAHDVVDNYIFTDLQASEATLKEVKHAARDRKGRDILNKICEYIDIVEREISHEH